ncbi:class I SAM-dependent RNA methyltransferase [Jannaschia ovalis]|uniref:Class I SAM-dependent RNA methyltransferase n=1 Tax=Jannaschia ovalis TaxID=3038773 RepID=A0ABY8LAS8_9RHOB|nr:class I SAM-dependent RNA methyltransferase [Jannaschia sp. GRR-S6-38]WGH77385.1 class I SAM-dependent RNA methyltransferase [Jannaschia sp. GRR-S6-38]
MSPPSDAEDATLTVARLSLLGDGVTEGPAGPVYVPRSLPGEVVTGAIAGDRIAAPKIVTPSPDRVAAPCPHFRRCGGCRLMHAADGFVAAWKAERVRGALARAGLAAEVGAPVTSPPGSRRRAVLAGRKTKKGAQLGFHVAGGTEIVAIPDCRLLRPEIMAALPHLEAITRIAAPRGAEIALHVTQGPAGLDLAITGAKPFDREAMLALAPLGAEFARITWNGETALQQSPPYQLFGGVRVVPPPGAFLQATAEGEAALVAAVTAAVAGAGRIVDLFAGCGTFSFPAAAIAPVQAVEGEAPQVAALAAGARHAPGLKAVDAVRRDLFRAPLTSDELAGFDTAVIDPPRAGAAAQVAEIAASTLRRVAFVSCDPGTFARDAATLVAAGFAMGPVMVVDQFRWSPHVELFARFDRG